MSKTVKRVSKTVKRAMRVMMIGLVAMLGVKAEAHYIVVKGRCVWHSLECYREDEAPQDPVPILFPPVGEVVATPLKVQVLCPGGVQDLDLSKEEWTLAAQKPILQSDITRVTTPRGKTSGNAEWTVVVSDAHFLEDPEAVFCPDRKNPQEVLIHEMSVKMNLYCSRFDPKCKPNVPHSTWEAKSCVLPVGFDVKNLPARGTPYSCSETTRCHEGVCEKL
ncbi:MAG: hypothetical protein ACREXS_11355 [Gammaproteobacteria bacterium]